MNYNKRAKQDAFNTASLKSPYDEFYKKIFSNAKLVIQGLKRYTGKTDDVELICRYSYDFDAFATADGDKKIIGINLATPCLLHFCFNVLIGNGGLFPKIGKPGLAHDYSYLEEFPVTMSSVQVLLEEAIVAIPGVSAPTDKKRMAFAAVLTELATLFIIAHELGHISCGHVDYKSRHFASPLISEISPLSRYIFGRNDIDLMCEYEADLVATQIIATFILQDEAIKSYLFAPFSTDTKKEKYEVLTMVAVAIYVLFLYLGHHSFKNGDIKKSRHPHPLLRINYTMKSILLIGKHSYALNLEDLNDRLTEAAEKVVEVWLQQFPAMKGEYEFTVEQVIAGNADLERLHKEHRAIFHPYGWFEPELWKEFSIG